MYRCNFLLVGKSPQVYPEGFSLRAGDGNRSSFENPKILKIGGLHARQVVSDHPQNVFRPFFQTIKVCFFCLFYDGGLNEGYLQLRKLNS